MLATFVIGLREGLEAALIVGIVAAFLKQRGSKQAMRWVWLGVGSALLICLAVGITLQVISKSLPQREQEGLETVIAAVAVVMVTYMVVWMRRHSRDLKGQLEGVAGSALAQGSAKALVAMAFLAVLREGLETAVFLLAAFQSSGNGLTAGLGALLGVLVAVVLGYGIYRGGVKINLSKFFRFTGLVLVLVAAGLVMSALHTAHEAGWLNSGQDRVFDASSLFANGTVQASLVTGVLGLQPKPVVIEIIGWAVYFIPVALYVTWPPARRVPWRPVAWVTATLSLLSLVAAVGFAVAAPDKPSAAGRPAWVATVTGTSSGILAGDSGTGSRTFRGEASWSTTGATVLDTEQRGGSEVERLTSTRSSAVTGVSGLPATVTLQQLQTLGGGRLPIGLRATDVSGPIPLTYSQQVSDTLWRSTATGVLLDANRRTVVTATATLSSRVFVIGSVGETVETPTAAARSTAAAADTADQRTIDKAERWGSDFPALFGTAAAVLLAIALVAIRALRREKRASAPTSPSGPSPAPPVDATAKQVERPARSADERVSAPGAAR